MTVDIHSILAATDFSPAADLAVERAALLAQQHEAALHLLHVMPAISWKMFGRALFEHPLVTEKQLYDAAKAQLNQVAEACNKCYGITVRCHVEIGKAYERLANYAHLHAIDLTVLGPHSGSFARDLFIGSTALRLLHKSTHPALIADTPAHVPYRSVLAAVDFSDSSPGVIDTAARIAPGAIIYALHIYDVLFEGKMRYAGVGDDVIEQYRQAAETEATRMMEEFLSESDAHGLILPLIRHGYPARVILDEAHALPADLIVMGKHNRSGLDEFLLGSVTESVLHRLDCDLLVVTENRS